MRNRVMTTIGTIGLLLLFAGCGKAGNFYEKGRESFVAGDFENALHYFSQALEENPNKAEYYLEQGYSLTALGRFEEARKALSSAVVETDLELTRKNNKRAWRAIGITYYEEGQYAQAKSYFEKALEESLLPELNKDIQMYLADALECEGNFEAAIEAYNTLLAENDDYGAGYRARGYMNYVQGNYEESLADYEKAIALDSKNFDLYFGKYNVLEKLGRTQEQKELLQVITGIENPSAEDSYFIAKAQYFSGSFEEALTGLSQAAEQGYEDAHYYMGEIYHKRSDYGEAIYHYKEYIDGAGAKDAAAYNQMAICLMKQERYQDAMETVYAGQELADPLHGRQLLFNEVVLLEKMGEYAAAYEKAAEYRNAYPEDEAIRTELEFLATRVRE